MHIQFAHLDLTFQEKREKLVKAFTIIAELDPIHILFHFLSLAISIAVMVADNSASNTLSSPKKLAKLPMRFVVSFLNIPPQEQRDGTPISKLSMLHLIQPLLGGCQITLVVFLTFGGWVEMLNFFKIHKFSMEEFEALLVWFPAKLEATTIYATQEFQWTNLPANRILFLAVKIYAKRLTKQTLKVKISWGDHSLCIACLQSNKLLIWL